MKIHRSLYMTEKTLVSEAQCLFEEHKLSALPICEGDIFIGVLDRDFIEEDAPPSMLMSTLPCTILPLGTK